MHRLEFTTSRNQDSEKPDCAEDSDPCRDRSLPTMTIVHGHFYQRLYGVPFVPTNSAPEKTSTMPPSTGSEISCQVVVAPVKGSFGIPRRYPAATNDDKDRGYFP